MTAQAGVGDVLPRLAGGEQRMPPLAAVRRRDDGAAVPTPVGDDPRDRRGRELGPVGQDHDGRLDVVREGGEPAAQRRARPALPVGAANAAESSLC